MDKITFGSTFRIPISQPGVNSAKKEKLVNLIKTYPNGLVGKSKSGYARVSVCDADDTAFISKLKNIGYRIYQKFDGENIDKENIDSFIKDKLIIRDYAQKGKNPKRMSQELRQKRDFERRYNKPFSYEDLLFDPNKN